MDAEGGVFSHHDATPKQQDAPVRSCAAGVSLTLIRPVRALHPTHLCPRLNASVNGGLPLPTDAAPDVAPHYMGRRLQRMLRPIADYVRLVTESPV